MNLNIHLTVWSAAVMDELMYIEYTVRQAINTR